MHYLKAASFLFRVDEIKVHPFFKDVEWKQVELLKVIFMLTLAPFEVEMPVKNAGNLNHIFL